MGVPERSLRDRFQQSEPVVDLTVSPPASAEVVVDVSIPTPSVVGQRFIIDATHEADVFGPNDSIVDHIIELEVQQLVALGDREDESREWLIDRTGCAWVALFERDAPRVAETVLGILRITGPTASDRVLRDLAYLQQSTTDSVEERICASLGVESIRPFLDFTTLDITPCGAKTLREQAHNFGRLLTLSMVASANSFLTGEVRFALALVHPDMWKGAARVGAAYEDPGFGIMDYKLSAKNTTPMPTQFVAINMVDMVAAMKSGQRSFMTRVGQCMEANGIDLDVLAERAGQALGPRRVSSTSQ